MTKNIYIVYHGWAFPEKIEEFKTLKKAISFIESQEYPDEYCYEKIILNEKGAEK